MLRIGVDTGGTFTDFHARGPGVDLVFKVPSTPDDPARAVIEGLARVEAMLARGRSSRAAEIVHGTTVATNALLTRRLARTAFVTTAGFEDLVEIARQNRPDLYDLAPGPAAPIVPRALRYGVRERLYIERTRGGALRVASRRFPSSRELERLGRRLVRMGVESIAIGFLHSWFRPAHERRVARALSGVGVPVSLSSGLSPEYREYERFSTAIASAALLPIVGGYLSRLAARTRPHRVSILQSDGTSASARGGVREPVRTVLSGPAGGALAAFELAGRLRERRVLSFDMGGTSTDVCLVDGALPRTRLKDVGGVVVRAPAIEVHTVGAGGGSIARRDIGGALRVGPESAGADPGPACYGRGRLATVTDAHVVLGRLGPGDLLGGDFPIDPRLARSAVSRLARALGLSTRRAAEGILEVVEATMERALAAISLERGHDPRLFSLYAFGGAGGLHACALAERLGIRRIVVPAAAGAFSASGLAAAAMGVELSRAAPSIGKGDRGIERTFRALEREARARMKRQGAKVSGLTLHRLADLRYEGQSHEITVAWGSSAPARFRRAHRLRYGHERPGSAVEIVTLRLRAESPPPALGSARAPGRAGSATPPARTTTIVVSGRAMRCASVAREVLRGRVSIAGPAIVHEYSATTFIAPGWTGSRARGGALVLRRRAR